MVSKGALGKAVQQLIKKFLIGSKWRMGLKSAVMLQLHQDQVIVGTGQMQASGFQLAVE